MSASPWLLRLAGRHLLPLLLLLFAVVMMGLRYQYQMATLVQDVVREEGSGLRERLGVDQGRIEARLGLDDRLALRRLVASLALVQGLEHAYLTDGQGKVLAAISRLDLGLSAAEVLSRPDKPPELSRLLSAPMPRAIEVRVEAGGQAFSGVVPLQGEHRLLVWMDNTQALALRRVVAQQELVRESLLTALAVAGLALLLHLLWFRRAQQLSRKLADMGAGDLSVRTGLQGRDELADIGAAADRMAMRLQQDQQALMRLKEVINRSPLVVIEWFRQPGWPVRYISDTVRQWGYEPADLLQGALHYSDLIHPDDAQRVHDEVDAYIAHGPDQYRQEYRIRCADGRWAWVDDRTSLERDERGRVSGISGVLLDISAQKEAERAQREQAQQLRMFYDLPFLGMAVSSPVDKRWLQVNDRLCEILGYSREELLRMNWAEMTPPGDLERNVELFDDLMAGQRDGYRMAKRYVRKDGQIVHTEIDVKALRDAEGQVHQLFATIQDVTERKAAEADLRRLGAMADHASDALLLTVDGRYEDCNPAAVRMFGCQERAELLGLSPTDTSPAVQPDGRPSDAAAAQFLASAMDGQAQRFEWRHRRRDGTDFDTEVGLVRFQMVDGRFGVIGILRDITERKAAEEDLRRSRALLLRAQDIARMGSWSQDLVGGLFSWSPQTYAIHELDPGQGALTLDAILDTLHPDDRERVAQAYARALEAGTPYDIRYRLRMADGRVKHLHVKGEFEFDGGLPVRSVGMVLDETELMLAQRERDRLVSVMATTSDIVSMADPQGRVFYFNRAGYEVLGLPADQPLDDVIRKVHPPWAAQRVLEEGIPTAVRDGRWLGETAVIDAKGQELPMSQLIVAHRGEDGEIEYFWTILRDMSERKAAEAALELERTQLAQAQAVAHVGSWTFFPGEQRLLWSDEHFRVLGFEPGAVEPSMERFLSVVHEDDLPRVLENLKHDTQSTASGVNRFEHRIVVAGAVRHVEERASVEVDESGRVFRIVGTTMDITERVQAEKALREAMDLLEMAESEALLGSWAGDVQTQRLMVSDQLFRNLGLEPAARPPSEAVYLDRIHPDDRAMMAEEMRINRQGGPARLLVFRTNPEHGPVRWLRRTARRIEREEQGLKPRYIGTLQDITEVVEAEEALRKANLELEKRVEERTAQLSQANQELEAFSYTVSHDLKAPLRGIDGYSQLLVEEYGPKLGDEGRDFVQRVRHGVQLMGDLINDLLEYSRMERRDMARGPVELLPLVRQAIDAYEADIRRMNVEIRLELPPLTLALDREGMAVVLRNLVGNAIKFSRDSRPPRIEVGGETRQGRHVIWVRDNGVGFDMKYHDRVFAIFQRLHRAEDFSGTGIGLALVAKAVQRMGGRVWAESAPGAGATFYLEFCA